MADAGIRCASSSSRLLSTASFVGSKTQSSRRKATMGSITKRYWGGRYGPLSRFAISQILAFSASSVWVFNGEIAPSAGEARCNSWVC